jgi:hypothetical protein
MARLIRPERHEFEVKANEVVHKPTGAIWSAYPGDPNWRYHRPGMLGNVLENAGYYRSDEVDEMACELLRKRLVKSG